MRAARRTPAELTVIGLDSAMAANAFAGSWYALAGARDWPREWLEGTPFKSYTGPGVILGAAVGGSHAAAAVALLKRVDRAPDVSVAASAIVIGWIAAQVAMIGYVSKLQPIVLGAGAFTGVLALRLRRRAASGG